MSGVEAWLIFWMIFGIEGAFRPVERVGEWVTGQDLLVPGIAAVDDPLWGRSGDAQPPTVQ